ncbi:MAG TPA: MauE/DoxX family redox-associated membrane protein [Solirubrobacteraceae bacterium]
MSTAVTIWLVIVLAASAGIKAWRFQRAAAALATYGVGGRAARPAAALAIALELGLALALAAGLAWAAAAVGGLFAAFTVLTTAALLAGRKGRPCACFGGGSRLGWSTSLRSALLAAAAALVALGWLGDAPSSYDRWLTVGLSLSLAAAAALALALVALAREVGVLRLGMSAAGALEIPQEGPAVGSPQAWATQAPAGPRAMLRLAVFSSEGCPLCRQVAPAVEHVRNDPLVAVEIYDELLAAATWRAVQVPGSPYAVALTLDGVVLSKGTFNGLGQLESILGTARFRERERPLAA